jgi:two-component system nitrate/nitrite response regulator NarL
MRILLIDDHTLFRVGLQGLLENRSIEVIASLGDGNEGIRVALEVQPDIILLDMRMPEPDGLTVLRLLREKGMEMPIVILTTSTDENDLVESLRNGASGYLLKDMEPDALVQSLREVQSGKLHLNWPAPWHVSYRVERKKKKRNRSMTFSAN